MPNPNRPELPSFNGERSHVLTTSARTTYVFVVGDTVPVQLIHPSQKFTRVGIENASENTGLIFIGGEDVENDSVALSLGSKRGRRILVGKGRDEDTTLAPWAIAESGETCYVICEFAI